MKQQILRYLLAMNATAFDSAIHALVLFCGVAGTHQVMDSVPALNGQQLAALFGIAFARAVLAYLDAHPVTALAAAVPSPTNPPAQSVKSDLGTAPADTAPRSPLAPASAPLPAPSSVPAAAAPKIPQLTITP